jgi:para-aminobenzoate synthetase component 1
MSFEELNKEIKKHRYSLLTNGNKHTNGFINQLLCSNKLTLQKPSSQSLTICFINYDYKNNIELFNPKRNNPLQCTEQPLFIEVEQMITLKELVFEPFKTNQKPIHIKPTISKDQYLEKVNALKQHIQQGDIYEINFCITFEAYDVCIDPINIYQKLNSISKAPYSALGKFDKQYIIASSPELFLSKKGNSLITKPIKGTAKRGLKQEDDNLLKVSLQNNLKERNENVMIVDVARNDLSRLAKKGSVKVDKLFDIESYEQVHQMVSTISCELKNDVSFEEIMKATFPMASMTGAPKIRAMELIDEYELYNRGPYSGALGYINENGDFDLNVLIRSIFYDEEKQYLSFTVGSAITAMCNPEEEYEESDEADSEEGDYSEEDHGSEGDSTETSDEEDYYMDYTDHESDVHQDHHSQSEQPAQPEMGAEPQSFRVLKFEDFISQNNK